MVLGKMTRKSVGMAFKMFGVFLSLIGIFTMIMDQLASPAEGAGGNSTARPMLLVSGACAAQSLSLDSAYVLQGTTASGAPLYRSDTGYYLFFDPSCDGRTSEPRWMFSLNKPSTSLTKDLDGDGDCAYNARHFSSNATGPPIGISTWRMPCNGVWQNVQLRFQERSLMGLESGSTVEGTSAPEKLIAKGACWSQAQVNTVYVLQGATASGAPYYKAEGGVYLFFDPNCDGRSSPSRWMLSMNAPSVSRTQDLDGDGECSNNGRLVSRDARQPPLGTAVWRMPCSGSWQDISLTFTEADRPQQAAIGTCSADSMSTGCCRLRALLR
eukprot:gb/GFBE01033993.1/.p1 GENE.gb/GFBE01033993.1/~~gb/GFBE01033993.1/.p1  ORF type:complete len:326 (+),score=46.58 gb/GFBE01033993.1/:1-978(+)